MKERVLSAKQMQELIDMGIDVSNASLYWAINKSTPNGRKQELMKPFLTFYMKNQVVGLERFEYVPAFTLQDILEILPTHKTFSEYNRTYNRCWVRLCSLENDNIHTELSNKSLLEAAFQMLKWCKENKYI